MSLYPGLTPEERLKRIAQIINKGIYLLALKERWFKDSSKDEKNHGIQPLNLAEQQIINFCKEKGRATNRDVQELLGWHRNTATGKLKKMAARGLLVKKGNCRHTYYILNIHRAPCSQIGNVLPQA